MKVTYTYRFATGESNTIYIKQKEFELLVELDRQDFNQNQKETRRHISLDALNASENLVAAVEDEPDSPCSKSQMATLRRALDDLTPAHRTLIKQVFFDDKTPTEIARSEGVHKSTVTRRLDRSLEKLKKLFGKVATFAVFVSYL